MSAAWRRAAGMSGASISVQPRSQYSSARRGRRFTTPGRPRCSCGCLRTSSQVGALVSKRQAPPCPGRAPAPSNAPADALPGAADTILLFTKDALHVLTSAKKGARPAGPAPALGQARWAARARPREARLRARAAGAFGSGGQCFCDRLRPACSKLPLCTSASQGTAGAVPAAPLGRDGHRRSPRRCRRRWARTRPPWRFQRSC